MPCAIITADKLPQLPRTFDEKVRRNFQPLDFFEVRVQIPVQLIRKQVLDMLVGIFAWRQADGVQDHKINGMSPRSWSEVGRR